MSTKKFIHRNQAEIFLFLSAFFIRFPFFFRDYIDKDESTFILMGQSIADGHLPYDVLWDLKPPLLFYFFGLIENVFPHSFVAIRFFGLVVVFLSALLLLRICRQLHLRNGFLIAAGYVVLSSEFGSLQGVMSEHFAVFFLLLGLVFFLRENGKNSLLLAGVAFGCAMLCKLNYAYAVGALMIVYAITAWRETNTKKAIKACAFLALGLLMPFVLVAIPFVASHKLMLFINSVFLAPLEYAKALQYNWLDKLKSTWWVLALSAVVCYAALKSARAYERKNILSVVAMLVGTVYTFYSSGIVNGHYLVQVYPFFLMLLLGLLLRVNYQPRLVVAAAFVVLVSFEAIAEYYYLISGLKNPVEYRPTFEVVSELKKRKLDDDKIFFADYHIGYWLLDQYPLTKSSTHPSNIARPYLFKYYDDPSKNSLQELRYIMEQVKPEVIVSQSDDLEFFPDNSPENIYFKKKLAVDFERIYTDTTDDIFIWERSEN
jgi:4-amino-4-deoxy-L-arabinose transferase-like glycosyltransferase